MCLGLRKQFGVLTISCFCLPFLRNKILITLLCSKYVVVLPICSHHSLFNKCPQIALGGRYSRDFFNRCGELRHIRRLRFWPINKVLMEKYDFSEQDANDLAEFLVPLLDFVPEKRPTAAQCLSHQWISAGPRLLEPSVADIQLEATDESLSENKRREKYDREAMEVGFANIAVNGA